MIWFGWVLWHINHCRLFNAKSSSYIYIECDFCEDTGYRPENLLEVMNDRERWRERVRDIRADGMTR